MNACRCSICLRCNSRELSLTSEDYTKGPFFQDPRSEHDVICKECLTAISDSVSLERKPKMINSVPDTDPVNPLVINPDLYDDIFQDDLDDDWVDTFVDPEDEDFDDYEDGEGTNHL